MRAAYLNQTINLLVTILMVPLLLKYLDLSEYILWGVFTTFGGITLQIENSIQVLSVREISREWHTGNSEALRHVVRRAKKTYSMLAAGVAGPFLVTVLLYLSYVAGEKVSAHWGIEWVLFAATFTINYYFGANNSILLAMEKVETYNHINTLTRVLYFVGTLLMLMAGFSVIGICISFASSVAVGCILISIVARRSLHENISSGYVRASGDNHIARTSGYDIAKYTLFTFSVFALYRGGVLVVVSFFPKDVVGSYTLVLQAFTILSTFALVPIPVWLARLVISILNDNSSEVIRELARTFLYVNLLFVTGTVLMLLFGNSLLGYIGSNVLLPGSTDLLIVALAFMVEINLSILINLLVTKRRYEFIRTYVACVAAGLSLALCGIWFSLGLFASMVVLPIIVQLVVCLPLIINRVCAELRPTPATFIALVIKSALTRDVALSQHRRLPVKD